jgi:hypothetical protein
MGSALYTQGRSSHLPMPTLRFSCYELGGLFRPRLGARGAVAGVHGRDHRRQHPGVAAQVEIESKFQSRLIML